MYQLKTTKTTGMPVTIPDYMWELLPYNKRILYEQIYADGIPDISRSMPDDPPYMSNTPFMQDISTATTDYGSDDNNPAGNDDSFSGFDGGDGGGGGASGDF